MDMHSQICILADGFSAILPTISDEPRQHLILEVSLSWKYLIL